MTEQEIERIIRAAQAAIDAWGMDGEASTELHELDQALDALAVYEKLRLGIL